MNILKQLYCNQYYELKPKGKGDSALGNGTALVTITLVMLILGLLFLLVALVPDFSDSMEDLLEDIFGRRGGRSIGVIIAGVTFVIIYLGIKYTLGKKENFEKLIIQFEALDEVDQKRISKNGMTFFLTGLGIFVLSVLLMMIFG